MTPNILKKAIAAAGALKSRLAARNRPNQANLPMTDDLERYFSDMYGKH